MKKTLILIALISCISALTACKSTYEQDKPIFTDGIWDGFSYVKYYEYPYTFSGDVILSPQNYYFFLGIRNEHDETSFDSADDAYLNISYGFYEAKYGMVDITEYLSSFEVDIYFINNIADLVGFNKDNQISFLFEDFTPVHTITDIFSCETKSFNDDYRCIGTKGENGEYIGFQNWMKIRIPDELLYFDNENLTIVSHVRAEGSDYLYLYERSVNIRESKVSYKKTDDGLMLENFQPKPYRGHYMDHDVVGYDGTDLLVGKNNTFAYKQDSVYYAEYLVSNDDNAEYILNKIAHSRRYTFKKDGVIYYKFNFYQTYWNEATSDIPEIIDPEILFNELTSYKVDVYKPLFEEKGIEFGAPYGVISSSSWSESDRYLNLQGIANEDRSCSITYYADGWIKSYICPENFGIESYVNLEYSTQLGWEYLQIDPNRVITKP